MLKQIGRRNKRIMQQNKRRYSISMAQGRKSQIEDSKNMEEHTTTEVSEWVNAWGTANSRTMGRGAVYRNSILHCVAGAPGRNLGWITRRSDAMYNTDRYTRRQKKRRHGESYRPSIRRNLTIRRLQDHGSYERFEYVGLYSWSSTVM